MRKKERTLSSREVMNRLKKASWVMVQIENEEWDYYSEVRLSEIEENWWEDTEKYYIQFAKNIYENVYEAYSRFEDKEEFIFSKKWNWIQEETDNGASLFTTKQGETEISLLLLEEQKESMELITLFGYPEIKRKFSKSNKVNIVVKSAIFQQVCTWKVERVEEEEDSICITGKGENIFRVSKSWNWIKERNWLDFEMGNTECIRTNINSNMGTTEIICTFYY